MNGHEADPTHPGRHELPPDATPPQIGDVQPRRRFGVLRRPRAFGVRAVILCVVLGAAIATQVRRDFGHGTPHLTGSAAWLSRGHLTG